MYHDLYEYHFDWRHPLLHHFDRSMEAWYKDAFHKLPRTILWELPNLVPLRTCLSFDKRVQVFCWYLTFDKPFDSRYRSMFWHLGSDSWYVLRRLLLFLTFRPSSRLNSGHGAVFVFRRFTSRHYSGLRRGGSQSHLASNRPALYASSRPKINLRGKATVLYGERLAKSHKFIFGHTIDTFTPFL